MNTEDKIAEQAAEIARLTKTIAWYQGQAGQRIGEAARAGIAGAPVRGAGEVPPSLLIRAYNSGYKSGHHDTVEAQYTDIDQRDMFTYHADVVADMIADGALAAPAPSEQAEPSPRIEIPAGVRAALDRMCTPLDTSRLDGWTAAQDARCMADIKNFIESLAATPAAPLPEQTGPSTRQEIVLVPKWAGQFDSFAQWVNKAQSWLDSPEYRRAMCVDNKGRRCAIGADMARARDEGAFPVRFFWECEPVAASPSPAPARQQEPSAPTDISKELREYVSNPGVHHTDYADKMMRSAANEIERLHTAKSHLILQAQIWRGEAKSQRAMVIGILARLGLPENDWEAKRLIVAHIAKLTGAPVSRVGGIASKESVETAAPGASIGDKQ